MLIAAKFRDFESKSLASNKRQKEKVCLIEIQKKNFPLELACVSNVMC
jgi:hypothetical protein